jgi:hypothetical protein
MSQKKSSVQSSLLDLIAINQKFNYNWVKNNDLTWKPFKSHWHAVQPEKTWGIGLDPGLNFGLCIIRPGEIECWHGRVESSEEAYELAIKIKGMASQIATTCVIEGASYGDVPGQVQLANVREGFRLGLIHRGVEVLTIPPSKVRKGAFGHGRATGFDIFPELNHNAADAVGMALYAAGWRDGEYTEKWVQERLPMIG